MIFARLAPRGEDKHGSGAWQAPRRGRKHNGIDFAAYPGTIILSPVNGTVTKLGYPYSDDMSYRYVEITDHEGLCHRLFYVEPLCEMNQTMLEGISDVGRVQDLTTRYPEITNHVHVEVKDGARYLNPEEY